MRPLTLRKGILLIGNYPPPFGGVPRHIEYLAPYLVEKGWDVHILSGGSRGIEYKNGFTIYKPSRRLKIFSIAKSLLKSKRGSCLNLKSVLKFSYRDWLRYRSYIDVGREIIEKNDIRIISTYNLYGYAPVGAGLSGEYGIPLVVTNFGEIYSHNTFLKKNMELVSYVCKVTKRFLAMSHHCAESYKLLGLSPNVEVIPYGVDIKKFSPMSDGLKIRNKFGLNNEDKVMLYVGRLVRDMGLHALLETIPQILQADERIKFFFVGEKGHLLSSALQLSRKYKKSIFLIPSVPFEDLPLYYAASTIVVVPTQGERACGSLAALEAMATGKPVIASNVGGIPEIVIDRETGILIPPEDSSALKEATLSLLKNESFIKKMGIFGRKRVETLFDKDKTNQKIEHIFKDVVGV